MTETNEKKTVDPAEVLAAAADEFKSVTAMQQAGFPGRLATAVIESARVAVTASRLQATAADAQLAEAAAKAAGATGIAGHARSRVAVQFAASNDVVQAAAAAAGANPGQARALVWYVAALQTAEGEVLSSTPAPKADEESKPSSRSRRSA